MRTWKFENVLIEKGMYKTNRNLTDTLEAIDPSATYIGTPLEGLDAFERQLKRFDIKVNDCVDSNDTVEKFFQRQQTAYLFPEYVIRTVKAGMKGSDYANNIIYATQTNISGLDYRSIVSVSKDNDEIRVPQIDIKTQENLVRFYRRGKTLHASYEALRFQRLNVFSIALKQIGSYIRKMQLLDCVNTIRNSVDNPPYYSDITFSKICDISKALDSNGFQLNTILASYEGVKELLNIFNDMQYYLGGVYKAHGMFIIPVSNILKNEIVGFDSRYAVEMIQSGGINVDYDKLIERQFEKTSISCSAGFNIIHKNAIKII